MPDLPSTGLAVLAALPAPLAGAARAVSDAVAAAGGDCWLVGGAVRDAMLGIDVHDVDLEVHGLQPAALEAALARVGPTKAVGRSFGVFKVQLRGLAAAVDVALPRPAGGRAPGAEISVSGDPFIGIEAALAGRDLSLNAMAVRVPDGALADPCGGQADLRAGLLRPASADRFGEDPLRALRAARFAARFGFALHPSLIGACAGLPVEEQPASRRLAELEQLLLGARPGVGVAALDALGVRAAALPGLEDAPLQAIADRLPPAPDRPRGEALAVALTALLAARPDAALALLDGLDLHSRAGAPVRAQVRAAWPWLSVAPAGAGPGLDAWLRRGAEVLRVDLALAAAAVAGPDPRWAARLDRAWALGVQAAPLLPLIDGAALRALGLPPGAEMGAALRLAREAQLDGQIADQEGAVALVRAAWSTGALAAPPVRPGGPAR